MNLLVSIEEKNLPELDDEFAKGVREGFENLTLMVARWPSATW